MTRAAESGREAGPPSRIVLALAGLALLMAASARLAQLVERREEDCVRALRQAKDKAAAGAHPRALVELLYSARLRMGWYVWVEGRYVFAGPSLEVTGARFP